MTWPSNSCWISWTICSRTPGRSICARTWVSTSVFTPARWRSPRCRGGSRTLRGSSRRLGAAEVVIHVDQHVAASGELDERVARAAVARIADASLVARRDGTRDTRATAARARRDRRSPSSRCRATTSPAWTSRHVRRRPRARRRAHRAPRRRRGCFDARSARECRPVDAVVAEQQFGHARDRCRPVHARDRESGRRPRPSAGARDAP